MGILITLLAILHDLNKLFVLSTGGTIQIDYGYLDRPAIDPSSPESISSLASTKKSFYTRQLFLPVLITVHQNLEPLNWDLLYLRSAEAQAVNPIANDATQQGTSEGGSGTEHLHPVEKLIAMTREGEVKEKNEYCLATLDVRNVWTIPFDIEFIVDNKIQGLDGCEYGMIIYERSLVI